MRLKMYAACAEYRRCQSCATSFFLQSRTKATKLLAMIGSEQQIAATERPRKRGRGRRVPNAGRHAANCGICRHPQREEIERDFIAWKSPAVIASDFELSDRATVYRHAHAFGLFTKRQRNVRAALERIIEQAGEVEVNASAVVAAVQAYAKINESGQWVERRESVNLNDLFDRMSADELEAYARDGKLPDWFPTSFADGPATNSARPELAESATHSDSQGVTNA